VIAHAKEPAPWLQGIKDRRPSNVVFVAQAAKAQDYDRGFKSIRPQAA
jgi:transposase